MDLHTVTALEPAAALPVRAGLARPFRPGDAWLAGGTSLFSEPQPGVDRLLDLTSLGWPAVEADDDGSGDVVVAATCTVAGLTAWASGPGAPRRAAALVAACADAFWAGWKVQAVATVGGNVVTALPAGPMTSLLAAVDAVATCWGADGRTRTLPVAELVTGDATTALAPGELVRSFTLPATALAARTAFARTSLTPLGRSAALLVAREDPTGEVVLTCTAATRRPVQLRWRSLAAVATGAAAAALDAAVGGVGERLDQRVWHDDVHGDPAWRRAMALRLAEDVLAQLRAGGGAGAAP